MGGSGRQWTFMEAGVGVESPGRPPDYVPLSRAAGTPLKQSMYVDLSGG
jgi:hypothetical protein